MPLVLYVFLRERREEILREWQSLVASEPREIMLADSALRDHLPAFLDELAAWLEQGEVPGTPRLRAATARHAAQRLSHSFQLAQLIHEFRLLRATILHVLLDAEGALQEWSGIERTAERVPELARLNAGLDLAITDCVEAFVDKRDAERREELTSQLMQADRMVSVGTLAAGVAHEINNPLTYVLASLDFTENALKEIEQRVPGERWDEVNEALGEVRVGAERVKHVVRDLKTFSRADEKRQGSIDVVPVIESSINMALNQIKYRARLVKDLGPIPPVLANETRLGQVFLNLLINAAQAIPEGQFHHNEIRVVTRTDDQGRAVVEVLDTGSGIPHDVLGRIFEPFFTTKPVGVGTGLGLAICHNIVASLGGEITVESRLNEGTAFRVTLPAARAVEGEDPPPALPEQQGRRGKVLVVDDEPPVGNCIGRLLRSEHEVVVLTDAQEARDRIARGDRFDVILCDLLMPRMTGMDLHAALMSVARDQADRMVLLTGGAFNATARHFLDTVPNQRIEKPFDSANLRAVVRGIVR